MDHYMPRILERSSLSANDTEDDIDWTSVSDFSGDDHLNRSLVTDTLVASRQSRRESQSDDVANTGLTITVLPPMPLHSPTTIVSQSTAGSFGNFNPHHEKRARPVARKSRNSFGQACMRCWIWEILALLVSILALMMIVLILYLFQGRSLLDWPCPITINSLIAICSTVMKAALSVPVAASISQAKWDWFHQEEGQTLADMEIYDQASRGLWGAMRMLTEIRWRHFSSFWAIIIILTLAIDPMTQQDLQDSYRSGNGLCFRGDDFLRIDANLLPLEVPEIVKASYIVNDGDTIHAGECALSWCLRTFPICVYENSTLNITYYIQPSDQYSDKYTLMPTNTSTSRFYVDVQSSNKISSGTKSLLTGRIRDENSRARYRGSWKGYPDSLNVRSKSPCPDSKSSDAISALGNSSSGTIEDKFHYIAAAMTEQIQSTCRLNEPTTFMGNGQAISNSSQTPTVNGIQQRKTGECHPIIHVQWVWLALPTSLVVLALILQIVTMVRTSRRDTPVWKSSTLALVFHGQGEVQEGVVHHLASAGGSGILDDIAGMEDVAAGIKVRLEYTGRGGWCLRQERPRLV
ncbi:hypothetical protein MMC29_006056 [Sticta canariensis]|nr:hypothetical protein [Sticta canariensis]